MQTKTSPHLLVGVTGNIGSGKSQLCAMLESHGVVRIDADDLARTVVEPGTSGLTAIMECFGTQYILADGSLNRPLMGQRIFGDPRARQQLENILHPLIRKEAAKACEQAVAAGASFITYEAALLLEGNHDAFVDRVVVVHAPADIRLQRVLIRDGFDEDSVRKRMQAQMSAKDQIQRADMAIDNSTDMANLAHSCTRLLSRFNDWLQEKYI